MPLVGLGVLILWLGWFGFNPGSTLAALGDRFAEVVVVTNLAAAAGVIAAVAVDVPEDEDDRHRHGRQRRDRGAGRDHRPSGYVEYWAAPIIGAVAGVIVVLRRATRSRRYLDDPVGALSAHGLAGIWGTLSCGIFTSPRLAEFNGVGDPGLWYSGSLHQLGAQALGVVIAFACVFVVSYASFFADQEDDRPARHPEEEDAGLDISEHGMYGYPEQFIPQPEYSRAAARRAPAPSGTGARAATSHDCQPPRPHRRAGRMKKIEAFIRHEAFEPIRTELLDKGFPSLSIIEAKGSGPPEGDRRARTAARP